jgi:hypothetical protein
MHKLKIRIDVMPKKVKILNCSDVYELLTQPYFNHSTNHLRILLVSCSTNKVHEVDPRHIEKVLSKPEFEQWNIS